MKLETCVLTGMSALIIGGCAAGERMDPSPRPAVVRTQRDVYAATASFEPGARRAWEDASRRALRSGLSAAAPLRERIGFPASAAHAVAWHFTLVRGQSLQITVTPSGGAPAPFVDMFHSVGGDLFRPVHWAGTSAGTRTFVARTGGEYVLRVQPPAGAGGTYDVDIRGERSLRFPVAGAGVNAITGVFGDARDRGARAHEGVDIMAPRGTPVLAVADGYIDKAHNTPTGGLVIWQADAAGELTYYYAHLDELLVHAGTYVSAGDEIGRVGNTGNARGAAPHLHFGIYRPGTVAIDPAPLLAGSAGPPAGVIHASSPGGTARITGDRVRLRRSPSRAGAIITELVAGTELLVLGDTGEWQRVVLEDGTSGFVSAGLTESVWSGTRQ